MIITMNDRKFDVTIKQVDCWNYLISVHEILSDGSYSYIGKAISNNVEVALKEMI